MQHKGKHFTEKKKRGRTTTDDEIDNDEITGEAVPQPVNPLWATVAIWQLKVSVLVQDSSPYFSLS